jgi:hypothetical protein
MNAGNISIICQQQLDPGVSVLLNTFLLHCQWGKMSKCLPPVFFGLSNISG